MIFLSGCGNWFLRGCATEGAGFRKCCVGSLERVMWVSERRFCLGKNSFILRFLRPSSSRSPPSLSPVSHFCSTASLIGSLLPPDRSSEAVWAEALKSRGINASALQHPRARGNSRDHRSEGAAKASTVPFPERGLKEPKDERNLTSPGPWLVPSEEQLSRTLRVPGAAQLALERAAGRRRH